MTQKKGFTLIELLVVVAIIGLLATLSMVAFSSAKAKTRDTRRVADIKQLQTALAMYYADNNGYPTTSEFVTGSALATGTSVYMAKIPGAPLPSNDGPCPIGLDKYVYDSANSNTYTLSYCLGGITGDIAAGYATATPGAIKQ